MSQTLVAVLASGSLLICHVLANTAQAIYPRARTQEFHISMPDAVVRAKLQHAIAGAARRLSASDCQKIFQEFFDDSGLPLQSTLDAVHQTGAEYLAHLRFVDGGDMARCRSSSRVVAFTEAGSHVVFICGERFQSQFSQDSEMTEMFSSMNFCILSDLARIHLRLRRLPTEYSSAAGDEERHRFARNAAAHGGYSAGPAASLYLRTDVRHPHVVLDEFCARR